MEEWLYWREVSQLKKFIEIVEDYPALRVVDDGDFEVDLSKEVSK